jgi:hypothetical protein
MQRLSALTEHISLLVDVTGAWTFSSDAVGDLVIVLECMLGAGAEEELSRAGLFIPSPWASGSRRGSCSARATCSW